MKVIRNFVVSGGLLRSNGDQAQAGDTVRLYPYEGEPFLGKVVSVAPVNCGADRAYAIEYDLDVVLRVCDLQDRGDVLDCCALLDENKADVTGANITGENIVKWQNRLMSAQVFTPEQYGAVGDGVIDDTASMQAAVDGHLGNQVSLSGDYLVTAGYNNKGTGLTGGGRILKTITGGVQQLNSYADTGKTHLGNEYLHAALLTMSTASPLGITIFGDSTVTNAYFAPGLSTFLTHALARKGIRSTLTITNNGVSGTDVSDWNPLPSLGAAMKLLIVKYGINDGMAGVSRLATFAATLRAKLAGIRAATHGGLGSLSIVLVGPNSTSDTPNGRDEVWYEQLREIYVRAARDFGCFYFDTYAYLQDSRHGAGIYMDNPFGDGRAIHPGNLMQMQIWGAVVDAMIPDSVVATFANSGPITPGFRVSLNGSQSIPSGVNTRVTFDNTQWNDFNSFNNSGNYFQPTVPGKYLLECGVNFELSAGHPVQIMIFKNGADYAHPMEAISTTANAYGASVIVDTDGLAYFELFVFQASGSPANIRGFSTPKFTWFAGAKVG